MAVITKIRNKYAKVAGGFIAFALVGFILMDALSGNTGRNLLSIFGGGDYALKVDGNAVSDQEFRSRVDEYETLFRIYGQNQNIDDAMRAQITERVMNEIIYEKSIQKQLDKLGLNVTKEIEKELIYGGNPDPLVQSFPAFKDPNTGAFNPEYVKAFEQQARAEDKAVWEKVKAYVVRNYSTQRYTALISNGVNTPGFLAENYITEGEWSAQLQFVKVPFATVNDNEIKVTDADLEAYIKKHAAIYSNPAAQRSIEYVSFDVLPSPEDTAVVVNAINAAKEELSNSTDVANTVNNLSEDPYNDVFMNKNMYTSTYADSIFNLPVGTVYGPYFEGGFYRVVRVMDRKTLPDSVKVRHILIQTKNQQGEEVRTDAAAIAKIDSIANAVSAGADFKTISEDFGKLQTGTESGGEFEYTLAQRKSVENQVGQAFDDFVFSGKAGDRKMIKVDQGGLHGYFYVEIVSQSGFSSTSKLAFISKSLNFSEDTYQDEYAKASAFVGKSTNAKAFDEAVTAGAYNKRVASNVKLGDFTIQGISNPREIIKWMFQAKKIGEVSPIFTIDNRFIVAKLTNVEEKGTAKLNEANRPMIEAAVKAEKKAEVITSKYKSLTSLDAIAQSAGQAIQADSVKFSNSFSPAIGFEPQIIGYAFYEGLQLNKMSGGLKGRDGVYYMVVTQRNTNVAAANPNMVQQHQMSMNAQLKNNVMGMYQDAVKRNANLKINPARLY